MELLSDTAGYGFFYDPALAGNTALSLFKCVYQSQLALWRTYVHLVRRQTQFLGLNALKPPFERSRNRLHLRDLRAASELQLQAVCHCSLFIMQSADPDQALGKEK